MGNKECAGQQRGLKLQTLRGIASPRGRDSTLDAHPVFGAERATRRCGQTNWLAKPSPSDTSGLRREERLGHSPDNGGELPSRENCKSLSDNNLDWLGGRDSNSELRVSASG
jgi:hypothetical protein